MSLGRLVLSVRNNKKSMTVEEFIKMTTPEAMTDIANDRVLVVVNGKLVNKDELNKKTVKERDIVMILPRIYGG